MDATSFALRLAAPVRDALKDIQAVVVRAAAFDAATAEHSFSVALDTVAAPITAAVAAEGPGLHLDMRPSGTMDLPQHAPLARETSSVDRVEVFALAHAAGLAEIAAKEAVDQARLATAIASGKAP